MLKKTCFLLAHNAVVKRRMGGLLIIRENSTSNTRASGSLLTDEENVQRQYRLNPEYPAVIPPSYHSSVELQRYESHVIMY